MKTKQQKKFPIIIVVVLFILGVGIVGAIFVKKFNMNPQQQRASVAVDDAAELKLLSAEIADGWKIPDLKYDIQIKNRVGNYARVFVIPLNQTLDPLQIIYLKTDGQWKYVNMGSTFPDLEAQIPDLFRE